MLSLYELRNVLKQHPMPVTLCVCTVGHSVVSSSLLPHGLQPTSCLSMKCSGKNTGVGCRFLLQGIFPTKGLNLRLLHLQVDSFFFFFYYYYFLLYNIVLVLPYFNMNPPWVYTYLQVDCLPLLHLGSPCASYLI